MILSDLKYSHLLFRNYNGRLINYNVIYPDIVLILLRVAGSIKIIDFIFTILSKLYNDRIYLVLIFEFMFKKKIKDKFKNFILGKSLKQEFGQKNLKKVH